MLLELRCDSLPVIKIRLLETPTFCLSPQEDVLFLRDCIIIRLSDVNWEIKVLY